eukprot:EC797429.1.p1 GENE.EC797429.1~~EC797429.1.p1  ORF type:complete len:79 (-),score=5.52 EC797429.1:165-401(-)
MRAPGNRLSHTDRCMTSIAALVPQLEEIMHHVRHHELAGSKARTKGAECQGAEWFTVTMGTTSLGTSASTVRHSHMHH